jgi:hypothetical protein
MAINRSVRPNCILRYRIVNAIAVASQFASAVSKKRRITSTGRP